MKKYKPAHGFTLIEGLIILAVILLTLGAGYYLYSNQTNDPVKEPARIERQSVTQDEGVVEAPEIQDTSDLEKAEQALDANDPAMSEKETAELEKEFADL